MVNHENMQKAKEDPRLSLNDRSMKIVALRDEGLLLWEIAEREGVTKERIRQILAKASASGDGPKASRQVVTRRAAILVGMSPEVRPGSFRRLMSKLGVTPVDTKRGRLYWNVNTLIKIVSPKCVVCESSIPLGRYARSVTCNRHCAVSRRTQLLKGKRMNSGRVKASSATS